MKLSCSAHVWRVSGPGGWHFATLPVEIGANIRFFGVAARRGWRSVPVLATVGATTWRTSVFPEKARATYLLPLQADVRRAEDLVAGKEIEVTIQFEAW